MTKMKDKKDTEKNVSDKIDRIEDNLNGGRTVVVRDAMCEMVLSSTYDEDTLDSMLNKIMIAKGLYPQPIPPGNGRPGYFG